MSVDFSNFLDVTYKIGAGVQQEQKRIVGFYRLISDSDGIA